MLDRLKKWMCAKFGHSFSYRALLVFKLKTNATNRDYSSVLRCRRCGREFELCPEFRAPVGTMVVEDEREE